jgi:hypothetical protein
MRRALRLDIDSALAGVEFIVGTTKFQREIFSSAPDQVLVQRLASSAKGGLNFTMKLSRAADLRRTSNGATENSFKRPSFAHRRLRAPAFRPGDTGVFYWQINGKTGRCQVFKTPGRSQFCLTWPGRDFSAGPAAIGFRPRAGRGILPP